ncbi:MAG TPA: efflux RND transporter periplasmic adaptor subunit [Candidatus Acidoferrales bacterium]|nr:efflux RND transporter periplasmic adaptor subunit [Candidatus Acidoferrales bacterium]
MERAETQPRRRWILWVTGAIVVVAVMLLLANRDQAPDVQTAQVKRENLTAYISSNGKVEPITPFIPLAPFATFVSKVVATEGQPVRRGQLILTLDDTSVRAQLAKAKADLLTAQAQLDNAAAGGAADQLAQINGDIRKAQIDVASLQKQQEELKQLVAQKAATQEELDLNQSKLAQAQTALDTAQQRKAALTAAAGVNLESARLEVQHDQELIRSLEEDVRNSTVIAPSDGTLYSLPVTVGQYLQMGQTLAAMADLHHVRVRAFVDEPDLGWLAPGQNVDIIWDALPGRVWSGKTETVPKQVVQRQVRSVGEVLCSVSNDKLELLPNVNVDVKIEVQERKNALAVPRGAVRVDGAQHFVFVVDGGVARKRPVDVGIANATEYEVTSGLKEGETVAIAGEAVLRDGMQVNPVEAR